MKDTDLIIIMAGVNSHRTPPRKLIYSKFTQRSDFLRQLSKSHRILDVFGMVRPSNVQRGTQVVELPHGTQVAGNHTAECTFATTHPVP